MQTSWTSRSPRERRLLADLISLPGVVETSRLDGAVGVMAIHGGLEAGTAEAAARIAGRSHSSVYAVVQPDDLRWHVPSIRFDPAQSVALRAFLEHVRLAVSLHGFGRRGLEDVVLVGGSNRRVARLIGDAIERRSPARVIADLDAIPSGLRGTHAANPVNLPEFGGVQLELSAGARQPDVLSQIVHAVASVLAAEQRGL